MKKILTIITALFLTANFAIADNETATHQVSITVPAVSLVDIEGPGENNSINLVFTAPTEAGLALDAPAPNTDLWLNLTSTAKSTSGGKSVGASITAGTLPDGITLKLKVDNATTGSGNKGTAGNEITLSGTSQPVITAIKSGFTGNGVNNGFQLTYTLDFDDEDYATLYNDITPLTITYTMTGE